MPSLMHIPQELQLQIIEDLELFPTTMLLRLTNKYFHNLIRPLSDEEMRRLEDEIYCCHHKLRCCVYCHRLRPRHNFVPHNLPVAILPEKYICIDCGICKGDYFYPRGEILEWNGRTRVMCDDCSDLPKGSPRRRESLCQECWKGLKQSRWVFPLWEGEPSEEDFLISQAKMAQWAGRLYHRTCCWKCRRWFRKCEALVETANRGEMENFPIGLAARCRRWFRKYGRWWRLQRGGTS